MRAQEWENMESIVKMGVSGKGTYGKKEQRDGSEAYGVNDTYAGTYAGYPDQKPAAAGEVRNAAENALSSAKKGTENQKPEKQTSEEEKRAERRRLSEEDRVLQGRRKKHYRMIMKYVIITIVLSYILIRLAGNLNSVLSALGKGINLLVTLLQPLFWGFVLAYILAPLVNSCEKSLRRVKLFGKKRGSRRGLAVAVTCAGTVLAILILLSVVVSAITRNIKIASLDDLVVIVQSFTNSLSSLQETIISRLNSMNISTKEVESAMSQLGNTITKLAKEMSSGLTGAVGHIGGFLTSLLFAIIFCVYFLLDYKGIIRYWNRVLLAVGGRKVKREFHVLVQDADAVFSGYIRGQLIDAFIMAILVSVSLSLIGVKYAVIIGILSGIGNLIPYVGPVVAYGSTILVCIVSGDLRRLLVAIIVLFVIQTLDGNVINPRLLSSSIDVHPMLVIASLIVGGAVGGIVGMLFAVPVAAFIKVQFDKVVDSLIKAREPEKSTASGRKRTRTKTGSKKKRPSKAAAAPAVPAAGSAAEEVSAETEA